MIISDELIILANLLFTTSIYFILIWLGDLPYQIIMIRSMSISKCFIFQNFILSKVNYLYTCLYCIIPWRCSTSSTDMRKASKFTPLRNLISKIYTTTKWSHNKKKGPAKNYITFLPSTLTFLPIILLSGLGLGLTKETLPSKW